MYYHGAKSHQVEAMKWITSILLLSSSLLFLNIPSALALEIQTYKLKPEDRRHDRGGTSVVYACNAGNKTGPCVDDPVLCTSQKGKFVGYCFFEGQYEGVCCIGLNPANSTLTTRPPHQEVNDETTTTAPSLPPATMTTQPIPPAPTMTTQTLPPAPTMTSDTFPPATMTTQSMPPPSTPSTQTMPPAPTMTSDTMPPAPTYTTQTMPPATMTTQSLPPSSSLSTQTMPPAPTMTSDTMPPAPTMTTQSMPPATMTTQSMPPSPTMTTQSMPPATMTTQSMPPSPTMTTQSMPPATMTTQSMPPAPTMSTQTMPPAPSMPTQTPPPAPSPPSGGLHDDSTTAPPTPPSMPTMTTQTMPPAPTMTTQTMPPGSTMTTQTMPPAPTMTTQSMPPATMTTQSMPPAPTMTTQSMPPSSTMTTQTMPPAPTMTTQSMPPATMTTQSMPPAPTMTTQSMPPSSTMTTQTMPPAPTMTTQTMPPAPTMTTQSVPPAPSETPPNTPEVPTAPQTPAPPTAPTPPQTPAPPTPPTQPPASTPPSHFDESSTTKQTMFPTMSTQQFPTMTTRNVSMSTMTTQAFPEMNLTVSTQQMNFTTEQWNMTTQSYNFTTQQMNLTTQAFPNMTMTTESMNFTTSEFNMTMSTQQMPEITGPTFPTTTTEATTDATTEAPTDSSTQPSFDLPQDGAGCGVSSSEIQSVFQNPSYPSLDTEPNIYEYSVIPRDEFCALRIEFLESHLAGKGMEGCSIDSVVIMSSMDTPTTPQCGLLQGYQFTVRQEPGQPVKIIVTTQSSAHLWSINATQIQCSSVRPYQDYESPDCGIKNPKEAPTGVSFHHAIKEEPKSIVPTKLLKSRRKTLRDIMSDPSLVPSKLLQTAVINRETNIKIVRGNETAVNEYPWQALLMVNGRPLCGASIINENWLVTAGHCVQLNLRYPLISVLTVDVGDHDLRTTKETKNVVSRVSKVVPNVQNEGVRNDIALIKLATKIPLGKTMRAVCLPQPKIPPDAYAGRTGITTGWGRTEDSVISPVLREAALPILSNEKCRQQWSSVGEGGGSIIDSGMVCAGGGEVGPCNGDSGGPLMVEEGGKHRLVGLTSFGLLRGCAVSGVPSVFSRVTAYLDWIALNLADA